MATPSVACMFCAANGLVIPPNTSLPLPVMEARPRAFRVTRRFCGGVGNGGGPREAPDGEGICDRCRRRVPREGARAVSLPRVCDECVRCAGDCEGRSERESDSEADREALPTTHPISASPGARSGLEAMTAASRSVACTRRIHPSRPGGAGEASSSAAIRLTAAPSRPCVFASA
jgi:hypothetical protein